MDSHEELCSIYMIGIESMDLPMETLIGLSVYK